MLNTLSPVEFVEFSDLESRREIWTELAAKSRNIFATWEWNETWWRHFAGDGEPTFLECRDPGDSAPFAILPLYETRLGPVRVLRLIGHGPGDVLGPICAPSDDARAGRALREALRRAGGPSLLLAERLPGGPSADVVAGEILNREANPTLEIQGRSWEEYIKTRSRNLREKLRRSGRKIQQSHAVTYRLCNDRMRLDLDFKDLMRLHRAQWGSSNFAKERVVAFHHELISALSDRGWVRLWIMEVDGEQAAAWYGFRFQGIEFFYQSGRDPRFDSHSVGFLMLVHTMKAAFEDGLDRYAFLRGDEPYKGRFATADAGLETHALGRGRIASATVGLGATAIKSAWLRKGMARFVQ